MVLHEKAQINWEGIVRNFIDQFLVPSAHMDMAFLLLGWVSSMHCLPGTTQKCLFTSGAEYNWNSSRLIGNIHRFDCSCLQQEDVFFPVYILQHNNYALFLPISNPCLLHNILLSKSPSVSSHLFTRAVTIAFRLASQPAKISFKVSILGKSQPLVKVLILF